jgi:hypothetical protein
LLQFRENPAAAAVVVAGDGGGRRPSTLKQKTTTKKNVCSFFFTLAFVLPPPKHKLSAQRCFVAMKLVIEYWYGCLCRRRPETELTHLFFLCATVRGARSYS